MGGKALKSVQTIRINKGQFDSISNKICERLKDNFTLIGIPTFYRNKETFGDIDILVSTTNINLDIRKYIFDTFSPNEIFHNGNCYSFDVDSVQIDLILTTDEHFQSYLTYLSGSDMGNFIGKIAMGFGCRYGQEGLWVEHYFKNTNLGKIYLSKNTKKIFEFLDLSYDKYLEGFDSLEDIFIFISKSKFFNWEKVQLENNNKVNRDRDKKRNTYQEFLKWIDENVRDDAHNYQSHKDKTLYYDMISEYFPEAKLEMYIREKEYLYCKDLLIKSKFNGGEIKRRFGLDGKELGDKIYQFKNTIKVIFPKETFDGYVLNNDSEQIYEDFKNYIE